MPLTDVNRIAVIMPKWIGDCVMATPALRALRQRHPNATITVVSKNVIASLLQPTGLVDQWVTYRSKKELFAKCWGLRKKRNDATLCFPNTLSTGLATWLTGARRRIGFNRNARKMLLTDSPTYARRDSEGSNISEIDRFLYITSFLDCLADDRRMEVHVTAENRLLCDQMLKSLKLDNARYLIVLNSLSLIHI